MPAAMFPRPPDNASTVIPAPAADLLEFKISRAWYLDLMLQRAAARSNTP